MVWMVGHVLPLTILLIEPLWVWSLHHGRVPPEAA